jgi:hypothetical protein
MVAVLLQLHQVQLNSTCRKRLANVWVPNIRPWPLTS